FQNLSFDARSYNNQESLQFGIENFIIDSKSPLYAEISEW
ncbi:6841_t:CDS:1, partial [Racocetra persica]